MRSDSNVDAGTAADATVCGNRIGQLLAATESDNRIGQLNRATESGS